MVLGILRQLGMLYERYGTMTGWSPPPTSLLKGKRLPDDLTLHALDGTVANLRSFEGKRLALSIVSPACGNCEVLLKQIADGSAFADEQVDAGAILSLAGPAATAELVRDVALPAHYRVLYDSTGQLKSSWRVRGTPVTVITDAQLRVDKQIIGPGGAGNPERYTQHGPSTTPSTVTPDEELVGSLGPQG
jgi:hypothetical protein